MTTSLLLAALVPMVKMLGYLVPFIGLTFGESAQADDDEKFNYIIADDLGTEQFTE